MHALVTTLSAGEPISQSDADLLLRDVAAGNVSPDGIATFLTAYRDRSPSSAEFSGFRNAMLSLATPLQLDRELLDLCGTGGDGKNTFNISTCAAFVVAACGIPVAKHGNNASSSKCGSSNILNGLGIKFPKNQLEAQRQLDVANVTFLHSPLWHPAMSAVAEVRKKLGFKTIFNLLGPVVNPAKPKYQVVGVHNSEVQRLYRDTLITGGDDFVIVHASDGYDEISLTNTVALQYRNKMVTISAADFGAERILPDALLGGETIEQSVALTERLLKGDGTIAQTSVVAANAALALCLARDSQDLKTHYAEAFGAIRGGEAYEALQALRGLR